MVVVGAIMFAALVSWLSLILRKNFSNNVGSGMGKVNNERWGMVDEKKYEQ